jgi:hypothetical protein
LTRKLTHLCEGLGDPVVIVGDAGGKWSQGESPAKSQSNSQHSGWILQCVAHRRVQYVEEDDLLSHRRLHDHVSREKEKQGLQAVKNWQRYQMVEQRRWSCSQHDLDLFEYPVYW